MLEKVPFYNFVNMISTGAVFCIVLMYLVLEKVDILNEITLLMSNQINQSVCFIITFYEIGLIINRIGSIIIEPIFLKTKIVNFASDYSQYSKKVVDFPILNILSREYSGSRTRVVLFLLLSLVALFFNKLIVSILLFSFVIIYIISMRKHADKINKIIKN